MILDVLLLIVLYHDDVIKWKHFPGYWPFVRVIHRWPVNSPHKGQWHGALMFFLRLNKRWVNNREAGDLRRYRAHCDVTVMLYNFVNHVAIPKYETLWYFYLESLMLGALIFLHMTRKKCINISLPFLYPGHRQRPTISQDFGAAWNRAWLSISRPTFSRVTNGFIDHFHRCIYIFSDNLSFFLKKTLFRYYIADVFSFGNCHVITRFITEQILQGLLVFKLD